MAIQKKDVSRPVRIRFIATVPTNHGVDHTLEVLSTGTYQAHSVKPDHRTANERPILLRQYKTPRR